MSTAPAPARTFAPFPLDNRGPATDHGEEEVDDTVVPFLRPKRTRTIITVNAYPISDFDAGIDAFLDMMMDGLENEPEAAHSLARTFVTELDGITGGNFPLVFHRLLEMNDECPIWILILVASKCDNARCLQMLIEHFANLDLAEEIWQKSEGENAEPVRTYRDLIAGYFLKMNPGIINPDLSQIRDAFTALVDGCSDMMRRALQIQIVENPSHWLHPAA